MSRRATAVVLAVAALTILADLGTKAWARSADATYGAAPCTVTGDFTMAAAHGGVIDRGRIVPQTYAVEFRTNQPNWTDLGTEEEPVWVSCVSKGTLERRVLEIAAGTMPGR